MDFTGLAAFCKLRNFWLCYGFCQGTLESKEILMNSTGFSESVLTVFQSLSEYFSISEYLFSIVRFNEYLYTMYLMPTLNIH